MQVVHGIKGVWDMKCIILTKLLLHNILCHRSKLKLERKYSIHRETEEVPTVTETRKGVLIMEPDRFTETLGKSYDNLTIAKFSSIT